VRFTPFAPLASRARTHCSKLAALLSTLAVTSLTVVLVPRSAGADQVADLTAQATVVSQELVLDQLQIDAYQRWYSLASEKVAAESKAIAQIGRSIGHDEQLVKGDTNNVRQLAIKSYMNGGVGLSSADAVLFVGNEERAQMASEYGSIAIGNIEAALNRLDSDHLVLQAHQTALQQKQIQDQATQMHQAALLEQTQSTQRQMESVQHEVTGKLAVAIAAQASAQAVAAAGAVVDAQIGGKSPQSADASGFPSGPDPVLNPYLQCVAEAESHGNYGAVSPDGLYMGAFQFSQPTWNMAAKAAGRPYLIGLHPNLATKADQDALAVALFALDGQQPWLGDRCRL
jgi:hypothetical protein